MGPDPILRLKQLTVRYGNFVAVDRLDLELRSSELFGLLGSDGASKSSTLRVLIGVEDGRVDEYLALVEPSEAADLLTIASLAGTQRAASMGAMSYTLAVALLLLICQQCGVPPVSYLAPGVPPPVHAARRPDRPAAARTLGPPRQGCSPGLCLGHPFPAPQLAVSRESATDEHGWTRIRRQMPSS